MDSEPENEFQEDRAAAEEVAGGAGARPNQGAGCMPAVLAATVLMGIIGFLTCGVTTWMLFGKRTELAIRTLEETYLPEIEQSRLRPEEKQAVVAQLRELLQDMKRDQLKPWQSGAVMQRLVRLPVIQWGELGAVEAWIDQADPEVWESTGVQDAESAKLQLSRLRRAIELDQATGVDLNDVLQPVLVADDSPLGRSLIEPRGLVHGDRERPKSGEKSVPESVAEVVKRAKTVADRSGVPEQAFPNVRIESLVRRQIETGIREGSF